MGKLLEDKEEKRQEEAKLIHTVTPCPLSHEIAWFSGISVQIKSQ